MKASGAAGPPLYRVLIVDDEPIARAGLRIMLGELPDITIAGEATTGVEAAVAIRTLKPDIVFLDIQMPDRDGFRVLAGLEPRERPAVVFVTAHAQHALSAFDVDAADYLLKPFDQTRLATALRRAIRDVRGGGHAGDHEADQDPIRGQQQKRTFASRVLVHDREAAYFVDLADVHWIEVYGNYLRLASGGRFHLIRRSMRSFVPQLDPSDFLRVSRSVIVNVQHVRQVEWQTNGQYAIALKEGAVLRSSRRYRREILNALNHLSRPEDRSPLND
ncbi:MAG TPA: LytTR family DNA-binding domain-containing protein [Gemmatimonadaceae bacterium]|nr:LytTR family DNA-binding domain-containing protein [Gemmatimonadaceae bacterium]